MMPGMNPRKMAQMMKKMGIQQTEIDATEVIIKTPDKELVITDPQVSKVNMMGQETLQIVGAIHEREIETEPDISEDDIKTVMEQANVSEEQAKAAIEEHKGDLAAAIMSLQK
ncbi:nascent polypeptide-associated complex protein [Candidatus Woesearchaeota archaeon]|jgi:nascent polypeptide-associated complex subunit alpha|nr:nascent polypeptide-associated complex protein [Candidatus Woesearchaeota archaeon]